MLAPSGCVTYAAFASRLNVVPVIPGAAACPAGASSEAAATAIASSSGWTQLARSLAIVARMAALLDRAGFGSRIDPGVIGRTDVGLRQASAEILGIIGQVIEVGRVE